MPPRATPSRRSARYTTRAPQEPEAAHADDASLMRINLPRLSGTPSSRRQYTYGSGPEAPPRPGGGLQRVDISNAVNQALTQENDDEVFVRPPPPRQAAAASTTEQLGASRSASKDKAPEPVQGSFESLMGGSDADSMRSFAMESDFFGEAIIGSTPESTPANEPPAQRPLAKSIRGAPPTASSRAGVETRSTVAGARPVRPVGPQVEVPKPTRRQPAAARQEPEAEGEEDEDEVSEPSGKTIALDHSQPKNTPAPRRTGLQSTRELRARTTAQQEAEKKRRSEAEKLAAAPRAGLQTRSGNASTLSKDPRTSLQIQETPKKSLFARSSRDAPPRDYPSDDSERDAAIQRDILEAEEQAASERRARQASERPDQPRQRWAWLTETWPFVLIFNNIRNRRRRMERERAEEDEDTVYPTEWVRLLYPMTYIQTLVWLFDSAMDRLVNWTDYISGTRPGNRASQPSSIFAWIRMGLFGLLLGVVILTTFSSLPDDWDMGAVSQISMPDFGRMVEKVGEMVPSISWPFGRDLDDLFEDPDVDRDGITAALRKHQKAIEALKRRTDLDSGSLEKLQNILPQVVKMEVKDGQPVVPSAFWHALRDQLREDGGFLTLEKKRGDYELSSEQQWQAITRQLLKDPAMTSSLNVTVGRMEDRLDSKMTTVWDAWVKNNEAKLSEIMGKEFDKIKSAGSGPEFDKRLAALVKEQLKGQETQQVVTRDEFLRHLKTEFAVYRTEIRAELAELQGQLDGFMKQLHALADKEAPETLSRSDVAAIANSAVKKAIADINLAAMAEGKIHLHWDTELKNQINYFSVGSGAIVDARRTSPTYDPLRKGVMSEEVFKRGLRGVQPLPPRAALHGWEDAGDCWCAARAINGRGNPHGATLSVQLAESIVPQHIALEHILPGATMDPGARPRNVEVYAYIADSTVRERVRSFADTHFPDDTKAWDYMAADYGSAFVKIGQFAYEGAELHDGVHVHQLSGELAGLGAETDQVIIRAVSNYGNVGHTCFYRVRLFGQRLDGS